MFGLNLGNWGSALKATGSGYELPATATQAPANVNSWQPPAGINDALQATGSQYSAPVEAPPAVPPPQATDTEVAGPAKGNAAGNMIGGLMSGVMGEKADTSGGTTGDQNQTGAFNKLGGVIGTVAKLWGGDFMGAAGGLKNMSGK